MDYGTDTPVVALINRDVSNLGVLSCENRWLGGQSRFAKVGRRWISQMQGYSANPLTLQLRKLSKISVKVV